MTTRPLITKRDVRWIATRLTVLLTLAFVVLGTSVGSDLKTWADSTIFNPSVLENSPSSYSGLGSGDPGARAWTFAD